MMPLVQQTMFGLMVTATEARHAVGVVGERMAIQMLERAGYGVVHCRNRSRRGDVLAIDQYTGEIFRVEVKTARLGKDKHYRFTLVKSGCTDYHDAQYLLLLPLSPAGVPVPFLIPVTEVNQRSISLYGSLESYAGKWASFRVSGELCLGVS